MHSLSVVVAVVVTTVIVCLGSTDVAVATDNCINSGKIATLTVTQSSGTFRRVQDAINAIPANNRRWIRVLVNPGTYREKVQIPYDKQCVILQGRSASNTIISFDAHRSTDESATFTSSADNFIAINIAFENTYDKTRATSWTQAVAARVYGDKSAFYGCHFFGVQDTLWDAHGRHYYKSCLIEGAVDFIWGSAQSVYEDCEIKVVREGGFITAQGRNGRGDPSGFVFIRGSVSGVGQQTYLGRAYGPYARVIFRQTSLDNVVSPLGWNPFNAVHHEQNVMFVEDNCKGAGSNLRDRVAWMKRLTQAQLSKYTVSAFIDQDHWISKQPRMAA